jgi:hypothetical protein
MFFKWHPGAATRIALLAALASATTGLFLAAFQVQGWTMPKPVAISLIVLLGAMIVTSASLIVYEALRAFRGWLDHRATTAAWVESTEPGVLDYEPDFLRAGTGFTKELGKLARDTGRLGEKLAKHTTRMTRAAGKSGRVKQRRANQAASVVSESAVYIEKRLEMLEAIAKDVRRNQDGLVATLSFETNQEIDEAKTWLEVLIESRDTVVEAADSTADYAQSVRSLEQQNPSRTLRIACERLGDALEGIVRLLRKVENGGGKTAKALERKISEAERQVKRP